METTLYEIKFKDGGVYKVYCANNTQYRKMIKSINDNNHKLESYAPIAKGITTQKDWSIVANNQ